MAKIKIEELSENIEIKKEEMEKVIGGIGNSFARLRQLTPLRLLSPQTQAIIDIDHSSIIDIDYLT